MPASFRSAAAAALLLALATATLATAPPAGAATHSVRINDGFFGPANLTIAVGDTVTWTNADDSPHTVTGAGGAFDSGTLDAGATFSHTFTAPGTFAYVCSFHDEMVGTITVVAATAPAPVGSTAAAPSTAVATNAAHAGDGHAGAPDTAVAPSEVPNGWIPPLLIGLGLVTLALGLLPMPAPAPAPSRRRATD